ncbi:coiled-coil domain-containing protein 173 isoform X2 [Vulpes lagopus]|uniref:coiled-coil domain-containing protein 173 isoform X2 n=1 Tax=Vulpes lagopus TaxID=494514 RepID=UPI001BC90D9D|nr:coiled-coil domain-containing protein 173 isoform X2 [Vulpes lagopus]
MPREEPGGRGWERRAGPPGLLRDPDHASAAVLAPGPLPQAPRSDLVPEPAPEGHPTRAPAHDFPRRRSPAFPARRPRCGAFAVPRRRLPSLPAALLSDCARRQTFDPLGTCSPRVGVALQNLRVPDASSEMLARFGRRCGGVGRARKNTEIKNSEEDQTLHPPLLPSTVDLRQVTIIPHNEWKRIRDSLDNLTRKAACLRAERKAKKEMHFRSQEVVKHWTNTYASGLLLSRVMKERDAQIEYQKNKIKSDKKWEEQLKLNIEKAFKEEQEKAEKRRRNRVALANDHLKQIKEHEEEEEIRRKHEKKDAEEIKRQNSLYELEMRKKLEKKKEDINESRKLFFEHMNDKNIIKAVELQQQEEEDEKIRKFIKAKKRLIQMGKEKEAETHRLMEERRERINNFLSELIKEKLDNEDLIIARDIAEAEAEWEKREKEKYEKNKAELKAIAEYRAVVMKNKEEEERQRKLEAKEQLLAIMKADQIFQEHEKEKKRKADKEHREVRDAHIQQMAKNKFNAKQEKQAELEYYRLAEALVAEKEKEFQDYAREVIELESESTNKYIYPLVKAVQEGHGGGRGPVFVDRGGLRPSYQANDATGVQLPFYNSQGSKYSNFQKSKGRLGFTW